MIIGTVQDKNPGDEDGFTPLHEATWLGNLDVCTLIIENIQDKNPASNDGQTPLQLAAEKGYLDIYKLIIRKTRIQGNTQFYFFAFYVRACVKNLNLHSCLEKMIIMVTVPSANHMTSLQFIFSVSEMDDGPRKHTKSIWYR